MTLDYGNYGLLNIPSYGQCRIYIDRSGDGEDGDGRDVGDGVCMGI